MKKLKLFILALCLLMMSCQSNKIVTDKVIVPELIFPKFPKIQRTVNEDGSWTIPKESVDAIAEYYIRIQETEENYNDLREIYEKFYEKSDK